MFVRLLVTWIWFNFPRHVLAAPTPVMMEDAPEPVFMGTDEATLLLLSFNALSLDAIPSSPLSLDAVPSSPLPPILQWGTALRPAGRGNQVVVADAGWQGAHALLLLVAALLLRTCRLWLARN